MVELGCTARAALARRLWVAGCGNALHANAPLLFSAERAVGSCCRMRKGLSKQDSPTFQLFSKGNGSARRLQTRFELFPTMQLGGAPRQECALPRLRLQVWTPGYGACHK